MNHNFLGVDVRAERHFSNNLNSRYNRDEMIIRIIHSFLDKSIISPWTAIIAGNPKGSHVLHKILQSKKKKKKKKKKRFDDVGEYNFQKQLITFNFLFLNFLFYREFSRYLTL